MSTAVKKPKNFDEAFDKAFEKAEKAKPEDTKVRITMWLDSDLYMELNRRADAGEAKGKYQRLMNELLRKALFLTPEKTNARFSIPANSEVVKLLREEIMKRLDEELDQERINLREEMDKTIENLVKHNLPIVQGVGGSLRSKKVGR